MIGNRQDRISDTTMMPSNVATSSNSNSSFKKKHHLRIFPRCPHIATVRWWVSSRKFQKNHLFNEEYWVIAWLGWRYLILKSDKRKNNSLKSSLLLFWLEPILEKLLATSLSSHSSKLCCNQTTYWISSFSSLSLWWIQMGFLLGTIELGCSVRIWTDILIRKTKNSFHKL